MSLRLEDDGGRERCIADRGGMYGGQEDVSSVELEITTISC
jgi:hypothetical protein